MPSPEVVHYQNALTRLFNGIFIPPIPLQPEWDPFADISDIHSPHLDYAVGPFAKGDLRFDDEYDDLMDNYSRLFRLLIDTYNNNIRDQHLLRPLDFIEVKYHNQNARALITIEIENTTTRKHIIGGIINASTLGRIGIMVAWNEESFITMKQQLNYIRFLNKKKLFRYKPANLIILNRNQLLEILNYCH